ncbi:MAG TPA: hypothetical protein VFO49_19660, partial [Nocardioides sp.]|nr:hypothetical protein [Nocardioides sp.]
MSQDPAHGDTSDRLFTAEDLERFARQQLEESAQPAPAKVQGDPLSDPIPGFPSSPPPSGPPPAQQSWPQAVRTDDTIQVPAVPAAPPSAPPPHAPPPSAPLEEPRRFMTATDFLDRR